MIGPSAEEVEDKEDLSTTEEGLKKVFEGAKKLVPSLNQEDIIAYFSGLRPVAGDDFIIRYEDKVPGFINAAGIQSPGLTAAPAIARMVCDILKENGLKLENKEDFISERKKPVHLFNIPLSETENLIKQDAGYGDIVCRCELVSAKEVEDAIASGARTLDGIKFRTRVPGWPLPRKLLHHPPDEDIKPKDPKVLDRDQQKRSRLEIIKEMRYD